MQKSKWLSLLSVSLCVAMIAYLASLCFAQTPTNKIAVQEKENLFALIDKLEKSLPFTGQTVAKLTGHTLNVDSNQSTEYEISWCTPHDSQKLITDILVKEPTKKKTDFIYSRGSVIIKINRQVDNITLKDILSHFGKESYIENQLLDTNGPRIQSYQYERKWGSLDFAIEPNAPHHLIDIYLVSSQIPHAF